MNWNELAEGHVVAHHTYEHRTMAENTIMHSRFVAGAQWQRGQLRTDEAVERVAQVMYEDELEQSWGYTAEWVRDTYRTLARAAIAALLGEEP